MTTKVVQAARQDINSEVQFSTTQGKVRTLVSLRMNGALKGSLIVENTELVDAVREVTGADLGFVLPEVDEGQAMVDHFQLTGAERVTEGSLHLVERRALSALASVRYLRANPPLDQVKVRELTTDIVAKRPHWTTDEAENLAKALLRAGWDKNPVF